MTELRIGRLHSRYRVTARSVAASVQATLDRVATAHLAEACASLAETLPEVAGDEVWLVRDLHVDLRLDLSSTARTGAVARAWSQRLLSALRSELANGAGEQVVRFPTRAAFTARFVAELVAGTAWQRWYLGAFSPLRPLPVGRAVGEALVREPDAALDVLAELWRSGDLEAVLLVLGPGDARRVLDAVVPAPATPGAAAGRDSARAYAALTAALRPPADPHLPGAVLRLLAAAAARGLAPPPGADRIAAAVLWLAELAGSSAEPQRLAAAVVRGRWAEALRLADRSPKAVNGDALAALEVLRTAAGGDECWLASLAADLGPAARSRAGPDAEPVVATRFGGLLLLWPVFCELWPESAGEGLHRLLAASLLFGDERRESLLRDPVLALLCGLERPPGAAALAEAAASPAPEVEPAAFCALVLRRFAAKLPGFGESSPGHLRRNFLEVPASVRLGPDAWQASVTGPPLQVVLRMAGMSTVRFVLPWSPHAEVTAELAWS